VETFADIDLLPNRARQWLTADQRSRLENPNVAVLA
jgi:hypothetical protein